jgi:hypothetical protein
MPLSPDVEIAIRTATRHALHDVLLSEEGQILMERVASTAALHAIQDFMLKIGMDTTSAASILALQSDMQQLRWWNKLTSSGATKLILTLIGVLTTGGWAMFLFGAKHYLQIP